MINQKNIHGKQELFLLGIFIIGILLSYMVVLNRGRVVLSEPIELRSTGLHVPLPTGRIWKSNQKWTYYEPENSLTLISAMYLSGKVEGRLICYYQLTNQKVPIEERLSAKANTENAAIDDMGTIQLGWATINWIKLKIKGSISDSFIGITDLPDGRSLMIESVMESDPKGAWKLFSTVCKGIQYKENELKARGNTFTRKLKEIGTIQLIETETNSTNKRIYLIDSTGNKNIDSRYLGFAVDVYNVKNQSNEPGIVRGETFYHYSGKVDTNSNTQFEVDNTADNFIWQSRSSGGRNMKVERSKDGSMKVVNIFTSEDEMIWPGSQAIPEMLIDSIVKTFVDNKTEPLVIDLISPSGIIIPTKIRMANEDDIAKWPDNRAKQGVVLEYFLSQKIQKYFFLNSSNNIIGKIDQSDQQVIWQRITGSELLEVEQFLPWQSDIKRLLNIEQEI